jgi:hypothetical protein
MPKPPGARLALLVRSTGPPIRVVKHTLYGPDLPIRVVQPTLYDLDHPIRVAFPTLSRPRHTNMAKEAPQIATTWPPYSP